VALEPDQCATCGGKGELWLEDLPEFTTECKACHGRGWLYKEAVKGAIHKVLEEAISGDYQTIFDKREAMTVAVLDALRSLDQEAPR
jgi:DnaJ-class molecular chaperone